MSLQFFHNICYIQSILSYTCKWEFYSSTGGRSECLKKVTIRSNCTFLYTVFSRFVIVILFYCFVVLILKANYFHLRNLVKHIFRLTIFDIWPNNYWKNNINLRQEKLSVIYIVHNSVIITCYMIINFKCLYSTVFSINTFNTQKGLLE